MSEPLPLADAAQRLRRRPGRPRKADALALGRPDLVVPTGALAFEVIDLLAEALYQEVAAHSVETPSGSAREGKGP